MAEARTIYYLELQPAPDEQIIKVDAIGPVDEAAMNALQEFIGRQMRLIEARKQVSAGADRG